jgi:hypothetical protein
VLVRAEVDRLWNRKLHFGKSAGLGISPRNPPVPTTTSELAEHMCHGMFPQLLELVNWRLSLFTERIDKFIQRTLSYLHHVTRDPFHIVVNNETRDNRRLNIVLGFGLQLHTPCAPQLSRLSARPLPFYDLQPMKCSFCKQFPASFFCLYSPGCNNVPCLPGHDD